jgi:hypothetical protein
VTGSIITVLSITGWWYTITYSHFEAEVVKHYPSAAATVMEQQAHWGPLYNHFNWGVYLIWWLAHLAVAMDSYTNVHGDERIERSLHTKAERTGWASDLDLIAARLVISHANRGLTSLLRRNPHVEWCTKMPPLPFCRTLHHAATPRILGR